MGESEQPSTSFPKIALTTFSLKEGFLAAQSIAAQLSFSGIFISKIPQKTSLIRIFVPNKNSENFFL